ncbi:hypothetical protein ACHAW6_009488 [Cyclotella cf. meneghiniana]
MLDVDAGPRCILISQQPIIDTPHQTSNARHNYESTMNRRERNTSPSPSERLRYDYRYDALRHRHSTPVQNRVVVSPPRDRFEQNILGERVDRFDLFPDDSDDEDTIFSDDSSDSDTGLPSHSKSNGVCADRNATIILVHENHDIIECCIIPNSQSGSTHFIPLFKHSNHFTLTKSALRKRLAEAALIEAMSGPGTRIRHSQSME